MMINFNLDYFIKLLYVLYSHRNENKDFSRLMTFDDFSKCGLSTNSNGKIQDYFVYHLQLVQNEHLVCTFINDLDSREIYFGLTEKGEYICNALFERGAKDFVTNLGNDVNFSIVFKACLAIGDVIVVDEKSKF